MALKNVQQQDLGAPSFTVGEGQNEDGTYVLGDASDGFVGSVVVQIVERSGGTCTFTVQGRSRQAGSTLAAATCPFVGLPYLLLNLGSTAQAGGTYATAAIADQGALFIIPASGLVPCLEVAWTSGVFDVYVSKLEGAAA